jgi:hypothetical protein
MRPNQRMDAVGARPSVILRDRPTTLPGQVWRPRRGPAADAQPLCRQPGSVVVAGLEKLDPVSEDLVDEAVRLVDPA